MTNTMQKLQNKLPTLPKYDFVNGDLIESEVKVYSFVRDEMLYVSAENGDDAADYYGEYRGGYAWINPILVDWAKANKGYFEWDNAGTIVFQQN